MKWLTPWMLWGALSGSVLAEAQDNAALNVVSGVEVSADSVIVLTRARPNFTTFTMSEPPRLVIDISEAVLGKNIPGQVAGAGGISAVKTATYGTDAAAIARIIITFKDEYETDIAVVDDTRLTVKIFGGPVRPEPPKPAPPPEVAEVAPSPAPAPTPAPEPESKTPSAPMAKAPPVEEEAESFSEEEGQDAEAFEEEETEAAPAPSVAPKTPQADEPQRAEEALEEKKRPEDEKQAEQTRLAEEERQRKAQEAQSAREVEEAQRSEAQAAREAEKARKEEARAEKARLQEEARAEKARLQDEARERKRQEAEEKARLAAEEKQRRKEALLTERELQRATAPLSTGTENEKTRILEFVGFKVEGGISRIFVRTNEPVRFQVREQGDKVMVLELENTRMGSPRLKLPLDTSFFDSPVLRIAPQQARGPTLIAEIQLRETARFRTQQDGNEVYVEVERR